jgi:hypothetical protein
MADPQKPNGQIF